VIVGFLLAKRDARTDGKQTLRMRVSAFSTHHTPLFAARRSLVSSGSGPEVGYRKV
jgi:hypothetical protein